MINLRDDKTEGRSGLVVQDGRLQLQPLNSEMEVSCCGSPPLSSSAAGLSKKVFYKEGGWWINEKRLGLQKDG